MNKNIAFRVFPVLIMLGLMSCGGGGGSGSSTGSPTGYNTAGGGPIGQITGALSQQEFDNQFSAPPNRQTINASSIAYVRPGANGASLRIIGADGNGDREILSLSGDQTADGQVVSINHLAWRPDNTEIAFVSNLDVSVAARDIYAITIDGSNLRRLTNPPRPIAYANFPQGTAVLSAFHPGAAGSQTIAYIEGAPQSWSRIGSSYALTTITYTVADFGPGVSQTSVVFNDPRQPNCYFDIAADVDVVPGQTTNIQGGLPVDLFEVYGCPRFLYPQWSSDGSSINYLYSFATEPNFSYFQVFDLNGASSDNLTPRPPFTELARFKTDLDFVVSGRAMQLAFRADQTFGSSKFLLISQKNSIVDHDHLVIGNLTNAEVITSVALCPVEVLFTPPPCILPDAIWIPNAQGNQIVYTQTIDNFETINRFKVTRLRRYTEINGVITDQILVELPNENLGRLAISPDGQDVIVERKTSSNASTDLWRYNFTNQTFTPFLQNAIQPAWSR